MSRFDVFTQDEKDALLDALGLYTEMDELDDPDPLTIIATYLYVELETETDAKLYIAGKQQ